MPVRIYRVSVDYLSWRLLPTEASFWKRENMFRLANMRPEWGTPIFYPRDPVRSTRLDFVDVSSSAFAYGQNVYESGLGELIAQCGEVLPAKIKCGPKLDENAFVFNCMVCYNCFDREEGKARWTPDGTMAIEVEKYAFHPERIGDANLFKIPETHRVAVYTVAGLKASEKEFFSLYHELGFTGLRFEEVWSTKA